MNTKQLLRVVAGVAAVGWAVGFFALGMGGTIHLLLPVAAVAFGLQTRIHVAPTAFQVWQTKHQAGGRRGGS